MSQSMTAAGKANPYAQNAALRAQFLASSLYIKKTLPAITVVAGVSQYAVPLTNQGALTGIDLEVSLNITAGTGAIVPQLGAPYSFISNLNFVDQSNIVRHNLSAWSLVDYLTYKNMKLPWGAAISLGQGGEGIVVNALDYSVPNIAANGTGVVKFWMHIPISKSRQDLTGMVLLQTGNNNQPAQLNITLTNLIAGQGNSPYSAAFTITGGSIVPHQCYYQPNAGVVAPPVDTQTEWVLTETLPDQTNLAAGLTKQIQFQTQFPTSTVMIRYFNGNAFTYGTDMTSVLEKTLGGTLTINDDTPLMRFRRFRIQHGYDCCPGEYWFDYSNAPLQNAAVGVYEADLTPSIVNAGAFVTQLYDWTKLPAALAQLPGAAQT